MCLALRHALLLDEKGFRAADVTLILELPLQLGILLEQALNLAAHRAEHLNRRNEGAGADRSRQDRDAGVAGSVKHLLISFL